MRQNKNYDIENLPDVTKRIKSIIDKEYNGNTRQFCLNMGLENSSKINRLFKIDKRSGNYPIPSSDVLLMIANTYNVKLDWLMKGDGNSEHVNNINVIRGDNNITSSSNIEVETENNYIEVIKKQQEQIDKLMSMLMEKKHG